MYDEIVKTVSMSSDEVDLLVTLLDSEVDNCLSVGEEITVKELLNKLLK